MNLLNAIELLRDEIKKLEHEAENEIKHHEKAIEEVNKYILSDVAPLKTALRKLKENNTVCEYCKGKREERYTDAAGDTDTRECSMCKGTGKALHYSETTSRWGSY